MTTGNSTFLSGNISSVCIKPAAIYSIFDQFQRRNELCTGRLIGAIFGTRQEEEGEILVSQAFPIPHSEINDQVNINSEYYKSRSELIKTCYGRSQYILGWYSIALEEGSQVQTENLNFSITSSFIHDVFSKEVIKSSPVNLAAAAVHLEILIGTDGQIKYSALMASEKSGNRFSFAPVKVCKVDYSVQEAFLANSLNYSLSLQEQNQEQEQELSASVVPFPAANEFNEAMTSEFMALVSKLKESTESDDQLLSLLPDSAAYEAQASKFKNDLSGLHEMVKVLCDQLKKSQELFLSKN